MQSQLWRERDAQDLECLHTRRFHIILGSGRSCGEGDTFVEACTVWVSWETWDVGRLWFMPLWIVCTRSYCQSMGAAVLAGPSSPHCTRISPLLLISQKRILSPTLYILLLLPTGQGLHAPGSAHSDSSEFLKFQGSLKVATQRGIVF